MQQPIIDLEKVDAWTASMRASFAGSDLGTWLVIGITAAVLLAVVFAAWRTSKEAPKSRF